MSLKEDLISNVQTFWSQSEQPHEPGYYRHVPIIDASASDDFELEFLRDFVSRNRPCVIKNLKEVQQWPILTYLKSLKSFEDYLIENIDKFPVNCTPNGLADDIADIPGEKEKVFMKPFEKEMTPEELFENLKDKPPGFVVYLSEQNNNLEERFEDLLYKGLVSKGLSLGKTCFGSEREAINLWIGDERSVSSIHRDFFENLYCVTHGTKIFHLFPPIAQTFLREKEFVQGRYVYDERAGSFKAAVERDGDKIPWATVDPIKDQTTDLEKLGLKANVSEGDVLYLPAMWYHRVTQSETTVAINYWYNMEFDHKWVYQSFVEASFRGMYFA